MAKRASPAKPGATGRKRASAKPKSKAAARKPARKAAKRSPSAPRSPGRRSSDLSAADALFKLLESPLVAELLAVGATAALAAIAESRFSRRKGDEGRTAKAAVKSAGKAAAAAIGRRLSNEVEEIRKASKQAK